MRTLLVPGDRQEILERLANFKPNSPRKWGRMSPNQAICHLSDSFLAVMGEMSVSPATGLFQRTVMKWFALQAPIHWPPNISTRPELDQLLGGGTPPADFDRDRSRLRDLMERFVESKSWVPHPIFGPMSRDEWMRWGYLHMDHHFRQFGV